MSNAFDSFKLSLVSSFNARVELEARKAVMSQEVNIDVTETNARTLLSECNNSMFTTLTQIEKGSLAHDAIVKILHTSKVNAETMFSQNVYAIEKIVRVARTIAGVASLDHYTRSAFLTAKNFALSECEDLTMTHDDLHCAITATRSRDAMKAPLIATFVLAKGMSTARTQASSSVNALLAFDVITEGRNLANQVAYTLNAEHKNTKRLLDIVK